jgi:hypothetical protein
MDQTRVRSPTDSDAEALCPNAVELGSLLGLSGIGIAKLRQRYPSSCY